MTVRRDRQCNAPSLARSRSDLLGPVAVRVGDYFHHVTVGVVEIEAATAVQMIDLAGLDAPRIGVIPDALRIYRPAGAQERVQHGSMWCVHTRSSAPRRRAS